MKVGIIGAGGIALKMAKTLKHLENAETMAKVIGQMHPEMTAPENLMVECTAVAARDLGRAKAFAEEHGFKKAYGSYDELLTDKEVEIVYIALPHSHHYQWTKAALNAGKHVLCEKAFAVNEKEAREMIELACAKRRLLAEAIWTRYMPSRKIINDIIKSGELGEVHTLSASLGYPIFMNERIIRPELAGGALLDLMVYPLNFASMALGDDIQRISADCVMHPTGVDGQDQVLLEYADRKMASLFTTIYTMTDRMGTIYGEKGFLQVQNINNPESLHLYRISSDNTPVFEKEYAIPKQISGYEYEVAACALAILEGKVECAEMPHKETLEIMRQMDAIKKKWTGNYE